MANLTRAIPTLPGSWYYDESQYARELAAVWYRDWVCVGREQELPRPGDYLLAAIGSQRVIVTRNAGGRVRAFHNTCRHRGSALCTEARGRFRNGRIVCPYHTWTYATSGELLATPGRIATPDFRPEDYSLYAVAVDTWAGFVFVSLADTPSETLEEFLGDEARMLRNWPLAEMVSVQTDRRTLRCNWKVFWENYSECYHCPRVHPELCKVVGTYASGFIDHTEDPTWVAAGPGDDGRPGLTPGHRTWAIGGETGLPDIPGLGAAERDAGMTFASFTASMFVIAHRDYARSVRLLPLGPETVELTVDWLLPQSSVGAGAAAFEKMFELSRLVIEQDGRVCELNQQGLRSRRHEHGVLMPQEHNLADFHRWLRERLERTEARS